METKIFIKATLALMIVGMGMITVGIMIGIPHEVNTLIGVMVLLLDMVRKLILEADHGA